MSIVQRLLEMNLMSGSPTLYEMRVNFSKGGYSGSQGEGGEGVGRGKGTCYSMTGDVGKTNSW